MELIEPKVELLYQEGGLQGIYKQIERAGRTCYKSEDKITVDSAVEFVRRIINNKHTAMLEHGTVYLCIPINEWHSYEDYSYGYLFNPYSKVNDNLVDWENWEGVVYITTNYRVIIENNWLDDLKYICEPTEYHSKRITVKFTCDRGVSHELVRHKNFVSHSSNTMKNKFRELLEG